MGLIKAFRDDCRYLRMDTDDSVFFARQLEYIKAASYDVLYVDHSAFRLFPISTEAGPAAKSITYRSYDQVGQAKIIADYGRDLPRVDVYGKEFLSPIRSIGASYGWSQQDIRSARMGGFNLEARKAQAAVRAHNDLINSIAWFGDTTFNLPGLKGTTGVTTKAAVVGDWGATGTSAEEMINDVSEPILDIINTTKGVEMPDTVVMPPAALAKLKSTPRSSTSDTSCLAFLQASWPGVTFETAVELQNWIGAQDAMLIYKRDPMKLSLEIPQGYEEFPAQNHALEVEVPTHSRIGGVIVYYPSSIQIRVGIQLAS